MKSKHICVHRVERRKEGLEILFLCINYIRSTCSHILEFVLQIEGNTT